MSRKKDIKEREAFTFYKSYFIAVQPLQKDEKLALYEAIFFYVFEGTEPIPFSGTSASIWTLIKPILSNSNKQFHNGSQTKAKRKPNESHSFFDFEANQKPTHQDNSTSTSTSTSIDPNSSEGGPGETGTPTPEKASIFYNETTKLLDGVTPEDLAYWGKCFPLVNLETELFAASAWLTENGKRKKNYRRFIANWLGNAQRDREAKNELQNMR